MNRLINQLNTWHGNLSQNTKALIDLMAHYVIAYAVLLNLGALTYYLGSICKELFIYTALLALFMIPIRLLSVHVMKVDKRNKYLKHLLNDILHKDESSHRSKNHRHIDDDDDEDDWFMKIAKG